MKSTLRILMTLAMGLLTASTPIPAAAATKTTAIRHGSDWTRVVRATAAGGYVMGNPGAPVKLVEYGSLTCPHCRAFDAVGVKPLVDGYVRPGLVSWEFRNFVRDPYDITAALVARCGGTGKFFPMVRALYASQPTWLSRLQAVDPAKLQALQVASPQRQFASIADWAGFAALSAQRGVPRARAAACLADPATPARLVQMNKAAVASYPDFSGTPNFAINGKLDGKITTWALLEPLLKEALRR